MDVNFIEMEQSLRKQLKEDQKQTMNTIQSLCELTRGHRELLDGRLVAIVKLCSHNFTQIANFMIFLCLFLIDLLTYPY